MRTLASSRCAAFAVVAAMGCWPALAEERATAPASESECWRLADELSAAALFGDAGEDEQHDVFVLLDRLQDACNAGQLAEAAATIGELEKALGK
jgi:hypothetical protein